MHKYEEYVLRNTESNGAIKLARKPPGMRRMKYAQEVALVYKPLLANNRERCSCSIKQV